MMKKIYLKPEIETVTAIERTHILSISNKGVTNAADNDPNKDNDGPGLDTGGGNGEMARSTSVNLWDNEVEDNNYVW